MSSFQYTFDTEDPKGSSLANQLDSFVRVGAKAAIGERIALEHVNLSLGQNDLTAQYGQGRHIAGKVGCMGYGTWAQMTDPLQFGGTPGVGSIWALSEAYTDGAFDYPAGTVLRYTSSGWISAQLKTQGTIYATDEEAVAGTTVDKAITPYQLVQSVVEKELVYRELNSGTFDLDQTGVVSKTYDIEDFADTGGLVVHANIRALYIRCYATGRQVLTGQTATPPVGDAQVIHMIASTTGEEIAYSETVYRLPIAKDQVSTTIANYGSANNVFEILACDQWEYWEAT